MYKKTSAALIIWLMFATSLSGQCPDRELLWKRIVYLRDTLKNSPEQQLLELVPYLDKVKQCTNPNDSVYALLLQRTGWLYAMKKDYLQSIKLIKQSIGVLNNNMIVLKGDRALPMRNYNNLRICYDSLNQRDAARACLDSCIAIGLRSKAGYNLVVPLLFTQANDYFSLGDYYRASEAAEIGIQVAQENFQSVDYAAYYIANFPIVKINSLIFLKKFDEAEKLITTLINENRKAGNESNFGVLYALNARVTEAKGDVKAALKFYNLAFNYNQKIDNRNACAEVLNNIGFNLYSRMLQQYDVALKYYYRALPYAGSGETVNILTNIANGYVAKNNFDSAFIFYERALSQIRPGISELDIVTRPDSLLDNTIIEYVSGLLLDKADAYYEQYKKEKKTNALSMAIRAYKLSDQFFDNIRRSQSEIQTKLFWRVNSRRLYEHAIDASYVAGLPENAFYFFEKSRAVLLNEQLNEKYLLRPAEMIALAQAKQNIISLGNELQKTGLSQNRINTIQKELFSHRQDQDKLLATIRRSNPLYYQGFFDTALITVSDVQQRILHGRSALLELFAGDSAVYSLLITQDAIHLNKIDKQEFDTLSRRFTSYTSNLKLQNANFNEYTSISNRLYRILFNNTPALPQAIIISPDGHFFPFEALVTAIGNIRPTYFLEKHAVSYTYSGRYLLNQFIQTESPTVNFLGVAPLRYPNNSALPELKGSDQSVNKIGLNFSNPNSLVAVDASRSNFMQQYSDYSMVQLYTHASDSSSRGEPVIWFADSALYLSDLISEKKPLTRLIVLSACRTGNGRLYMGEGVFSFNREFASLGIPSAITNLWSVDSKPTYQVTELFYKYLAKGLSSDIALQKAKLELINSNDYSLPFFWAAPILTGKAEVIELKKSIHWKWIVSGAFILLLLYIGWIIWMRSTRLPAKIKGSDTVT